MKERRTDMAEKLSITLPPEMVRTIKGKVEAGAYASTSEVIREAVRVWQRQEEEHSERLAAIRVRVQRALADTRPDVPLAEAFDRLAAHHADTMKSR
jgi:antitoxin ParD1/3/4